MAAVPKNDIAGMSSAQLDSYCTREKSDIRSILDSNRMTMTQVVKDRINVLNTIKEVGIKKEYVVEDIEWGDYSRCFDAHQTFKEGTLVVTSAKSQTSSYHIARALFIFKEENL